MNRAKPANGVFDKFGSLPIQRKVSVTVITSVLVILSVISAFDIVRERSAMLRMVENDAVVNAEIIASSSITALLFADKKTAEEVLATLSASPRVISAVLYDHSPKVFAGYSKAGPDAEVTGAGPLEEGFHYGKGRIIFSRNILFNGRSVGNISIASTLRDIDAVLRRHVLYAAFALACAFLGALFLSSLLQRFVVRPILELRDAMDSVSKSNDYSIRLAKNRDDEIGYLIEGFNHMLSQAQRREEEEKRHLMEKDELLKDIHDGVGGILTNINMLAELALKREPAADAGRISKTISDLSREGISEIRSFMQCLDDRNLDWADFAAGLRRYGSSMLEPHGIAFEMNASFPDGVAPPDTLRGINLYRIYKEAVANIVKHAGASSVDVSLKVGPEALSLSISDDGVGLGGAGRGRGLSNMKSRAEAIGGRLEITSGNGTTRVSLDVPLPRKYPGGGMQSGPPGG